jgi:hypothetical protein
MTIKEKVTTRGGNIGYRMQRSKIKIGPDGYGAVVPVARERLMQKLGYDPGPDIVAAHKNFGSHNGADQEATFKSRSWNSAQSNMHRDKNGYTATDKIRMKNYKDPVKKKKTLKEIVKPQRSK